MPSPKVVFLDSMTITRGFTVPEMLRSLLDKKEEVIKPERMEALDSFFVKLMYRGISLDHSSDSEVTDIKYDIIRLINPRHRSPTYSLLVLGITNGSDHVVVVYNTSNESLRLAKKVELLDRARPQFNNELQRLREALVSYPHWEHSRKFNPIDIATFTERYMSLPDENALVQNLVWRHIDGVAEQDQRMYIYWR